MKKIFLGNFLRKQTRLSESFKKRRYLLTEADKSRFINPIWDELESNIDMIIPYIGDIDKFPTRLDIIRWVNSGAANKYKIDWQKFDPKRNNWTPESVATDIIKPYLDYTAEKAIKLNPKTNFQNKNDFEILFENDDYLFVGVKTYRGAIYCDSFQCGGAGAKWCIGYKRTSSYWESYNFLENKRFVLAYNKTLFGDKNKQKYMLEISEDGHCKAWTQDDKVKNTMKTDKVCEFFSITRQDLSNFYAELYKNTATPKISDLSIKDIVLSEQNVVIDDSVETVNASGLDCEDFHYGYMCSFVKFGKNTRRIRVDGGGMELYLDDFTLGARNLSELSYVENAQITEFVVTNFSKVVIRDLYVGKNSPKLKFVNCGNIDVETLHLPNGFDPDENSFSSVSALLKEYNAYARGVETENLQVSRVRFFPVSDICDEFFEKDGWRILGTYNIENILNGTNDLESITGYRKVFIDFDGTEDLFENGSFDLGDIVTGTPNGIIWCLNVPQDCEVTYDKQPEARVYVKYCI